MIRGYFGGYPGRLRPFVIANVTIPSLGLVGIVLFWSILVRIPLFWRPGMLSHRGLSSGDYPKPLPAQE